MNGHDHSVSSQSLFAFGIAMILHGIIDGLLIGVFKEVEEITLLAITVIIHRIPEGYTVGLTFYKQEKNLLANKGHLVFFILYVLSSPVAIIVGASVQNSGGLTIVIV